MTYTKEEIQANREKWLRALETTTEKQGRGRLGTSERGFCCLGLGCVALGLEYNSNQTSSGALRSAVGLRTIDGKPSNNSGLVALIYVNDNLREDFPTIAKRLRENMAEYFKENTL